MAVQQRMNVLALDLWQEVRTAFEVEKGAAVAGLWLAGARPIEFARGTFVLGLPTAVVRDWVDHRYRADLESIFQRLTGSPVRVRLEVDVSLATPVAPAEAAGAAALAAPQREPLEDSFLVCPENKLASAAVARVLRQPATGNPVFLYGPQGAGKSALLRHHLRRFAEDAGAPRSAVSVTAEAFSNGLVRALREGELAAFRGRMLAADAFVLEEAHRLRGKARTQREFLSVLRYHIERGRPVLVTSRHPPNAIFLLDEALRSYFLSGILLRLPEPGAASRLQILERIASKYHRPVPARTIERIAARIQGSFDRQVRFLEKAAGFAALAGEEATPEFLAERFPELAGGDAEPDVGKMLALVAERFGVAAADIASAKKTRSCVVARHVVLYVAVEVLGLKTRSVMRHLGGLSPSTTVYARRKVEQMRREDPLFDARVRRLLDDVRAGQRLLF